MENFLGSHKTLALKKWKIFLGRVVTLCLVDLSLGWYDVYLPILIADCLQVYHCFNCFIRYRLSIDPILHHSFVFAFGKRVLFTLLVGMAKYLFYYSMEEYQDPESRRYRTGPFKKFHFPYNHFFRIATWQFLNGKRVRHLYAGGFDVSSFPKESFNRNLKLFTSRNRSDFLL